jgi:hypothetical protein
MNNKKYLLTTVSGLALATSVLIISSCSMPLTPTIHSSSRLSNSSSSTSEVTSPVSSTTTESTTTTVTSQTALPTKPLDDKAASSLTSSNAASEDTELTDLLKDLPSSFNPYVLAPSSLTEEIYKKAYNNLPEYMQIQGDRNPVAREYVVRTLFENPHEAIDPQAYENPVDAGPYPYYIQWDERWGFDEYSGAYMASDGCGPTVLSMIYSGLTGDKSMDPGVMGQWAKDHGYSAYGNGSYRSLMLEGARELGLESSELYLDYNAMVEAIEKGHPLIVIVGPGHFTSGGHFIILYAMDGDNFKILDPFNYENTLMTWSYEDLAPQIENIWEYSY